MTDDSQQPTTRVVETIDDPLLQRNNRVIGDRDVLGAHLRAALRDVAVAAADVLAEKALECREAHRHHERRQPPGVPTRGPAEPRRFYRYVDVGHDPPSWQGASWYTRPGDTDSLRRGTQSMWAAIIARRSGVTRIRSDGKKSGISPRATDA